MNKILDERELCDLECLSIGAFAPLTNYMTKTQYQECLTSMTIDSAVFPIPIVLSMDCTVEQGTSIQLKHATGVLHATLCVEECWKPNLEEECVSVFGCFDENHPYIQYLLSKQNLHYVSGSLTIHNSVFHTNFMEYRLTPLQMKEKALTNSFTAFTAFQTRNPLHRSHIELIRNAAISSGSSTILLHPVEGVTQECDIPFPVRMACYKKALPYLGNVTLSILPLSMRMAGPREAVWHAVIRRNYGCTHFIVGRDHAGPSYKKKDGMSFYSPLAAQRLCSSLESLLGIKIIASEELVYCENNTSYKKISEVLPSDSVRNISGTEFRSMLELGKSIPVWYSYPEVVSVLRSYYNKPKGICYYFVGLSGSGKSTYAETLKGYFEENFLDVTLLDADIIRTHLSKGLGFSKEDRSLNVRRIGYVASEIVKHGGIVIVANIAPYEEDRLFNRNLISQNGRYVEIFADTPLETCIERDVKGLYKAALAGTLANFTGISDPFETPTGCIRITPIEKKLLHLPLRAFLPQLRIRNKILVLGGSPQWIGFLQACGVVTNSAQNHDSLLYSYPGSALVREFAPTKIVFVKRFMEDSVRDFYDSGVWNQVFVQLRGPSNNVSTALSLSQDCPYATLNDYVTHVLATGEEPFGLAAFTNTWENQPNVFFVKESELSKNSSLDAFLGLESGTCALFPGQPIRKPYDFETTPYRILLTDLD